MADWLNDPTGDLSSQPVVDPGAAPSFTDWLAPPPDIKPVLRGAVTQNPDEVAKTNKLSQQTGVPAAAIAADPKPFEDEAKVSAVDISTAGAPVTRQFMSNPDNAAIAHDDAANLAGMEKAWKTPERYQDPNHADPAEGQESLDLVRSIGSNVAGFARSILQTPKNLEDIANRALDKLFALTGLVGTAEEQAAKREEFKAADPAEFLYALGQRADAVDKTLAVPEERQTLGTQTAGALGQVGAQIALAIATGGASSAASLYGMVSQGVDQMEQSVEATGKAGTTQGDLAVLAGAGVTAITEKFGLHQLLDKIPASTKNWVLRTLSGFSTEAVQEITEQVGQNLTLLATVDPTQPVLQGVANSGEVGGMAGAIVSALIPGHAAHVAQHNKERLDASKAAIDASPLMERDPALLAQHFSAVAQSNGVTDIYVPADKLIEVYGKPDDPASVNEVAQTLGIPAEDMRDAYLNGHDVRFSPEQFAKSILMSDKYNDIADDVRQHPGDLTVNEATEAQKAVIKKATAPKEETKGSPEQFTALKDAGFTEEDIAGLSEEDIHDLVGAPAPSPEVSGKPTEPNDPAVTQASDIAQSQLGLQGMFATAEEAGMTPKQYQNYAAGISSANDKAAFRLQQKVNKEKLKQTTDQWTALRETERRSVEDEVNQEPNYAPLIVGNAGVEQIDQGSIERMFEDTPRYDQKTGINSTETAAEQFNKIKDDLPKRTDGKRVYAAKGGMNVEIAAKLHGFNSGIDFITSLLAAEPRTERIERLTDQRMQEKHNDLGNQKKLLEAAVQETHSDQHAAILAQEVNQLAQAKKEKRVKAKDIRRYAKAKFGDFLLREVVPDKFFTAATRFGREAGKLLRKGNRTGAVISKFKQLMQFQMAREAYDFRAQMAKDLKYLNRLNRKSMDWSDVHSDYAAKIKELLSPVALAPDAGAARLAKWFAKRAEEDGATFSPEVLRAAGIRQNVRDMTVSQFRDFVSTIREIHAQGRDAKTALKALEKVDREALVADLVQTLDDRSVTSRKKALAEHGSLGKIGKIKDKLLALEAATRIMEFAFHQLDKFAFGGLWHKTFFQTVAHAETKQNDMMGKLIDPLTTKLLALDRKMPRAMRLAREVYVPSLGQNFRIGELFGLALNMGNASNFDAVIRGGKTANGYAKDWEPEDLMKAISLLSPEHLKLAQEFWDTFEGMHPEVASIYAAEHGQPPEHIEPREMTINGVKMKGGYFPVKYDSSRNTPKSTKTVDVAKTDLATQDLQETVYSGMTKARTGSSRAVDVRLENVMRGFAQTVHYITHYDAIRSVYKLSKSEVLRHELDQKVGPEFLDQLDAWIGSVASGIHSFPDPGIKSFSGVLNWIGQNAVSAALAFNFMTDFKQVLGAGPAIMYLGQGPDGKGFSTIKGASAFVKGVGGTLSSASNPAKAGIRWMTAGLVQMAEDPDTAIRQAFEKSGEIRHRVQNVERQVNLDIQKLSGEDGVLKKFARAGLWPLRMAQFYGVDMPAWIGAYNQGLAHHLTDKAAVEYADQVLRQSQGSGATKDLSAIQRSETLAPMTRLASWSFTSWNQTTNNVRSVKDKGWKDLPAGAQRAIWALLLPALAQELLRSGGDKDPWAKRTLMAILGGLSSAIPVVGPYMASAAGGYDPHLSMADTFGSDIAKAFKAAEGGHSEKAIGDLILALSRLSGLPVVQGKRTYSAVEAGSDNPLDYITGVKK